MTKSAFPDAPPKKKVRKKTQKNKADEPGLSRIKPESGESYAERLTAEVSRQCTSQLQRETLACFPGPDGSLFFHLSGKRIEITARQQREATSIENQAYGILRKARSRAANTSDYSVSEHQHDLRKFCEDLLKETAPAEEAVAILARADDETGKIASPVERDAAATNLLRREIIERMRD